MASEYSYDIKIPLERVAVLIGKQGQVKRDVERSTDTTLDIDSKEGDVRIVGNEALTLLAAREIVTAIGRGFNPDIALRLLKQDFSFELINIMDYAKSKNDLARLRGRVIGKEGKSRDVIEQLTSTDICVYGKTVGIIGRVEDVPNARRAIESLLSGSVHASVYKWLERQRRELKMQEIKEEM